MKTLKLYSGLFIAMCLLIPAGCNEIPTSTKSEIPSINKSQITNPDTALVEHTFIATYKLKTGETLYLDYNNTELILIKSYSVTNCGAVRRDLLIRSSNMIGSLPCEWDCGPGLLLEDLSIKNVSGMTKKIKIKMDGFTLDH